MVAKNAEYETLLRDLSIRVGSDDQESIEKALILDTIPDEDEDEEPRASFSKKRHKPDDGPGNNDEAQEMEAAAGTVGSNESIDRIDEDFNRTENVRATGYLGKNSEVRWMQRLKENAAYGSSGAEARRAQDKAESPSATGTDATASWETRASRGDVYLSDATYHLDDMTLSIPDQVEPYELPTRQDADMLLNCYMVHVQFAFPFLGKASFATQYLTYFDSLRSGGSQARPGPKWLAILNLIFAIGAKFSHLIQAEWSGDERDHLIYFTRARLLGMNSDSIFEHPDLQQIQVTGLFALYLLSTNQINHAYNMSGMALRQSVTLGLNLRNEDKSQSEPSREIRSRMWWAVYSVERILGVMTGRPSGISEADCTTPLPVPLDEELFPASERIYDHAGKPDLYPTIIDPRSAEVALPTRSSASHHSQMRRPSSSSGTTHSPQPSRAKLASNALYFISQIQLSMLTQEILDRLYCPVTGAMSWAMVQSNMTEMEIKLEKWESGLPTDLAFSKEQAGEEFTQQRQCLAFAYYSAKIMINRPCLCRIERRMPRQSEDSKEFNRATAQACTEAAQQIMELLPDDVDPVQMYKSGPWWCVLHYIVQSATVLMLELSFRSDHMPDQAGELLRSAQKSVQWLRFMSSENTAAHRAWIMTRTMLEKVAGHLGAGMHDVSAATPNPPPAETRSTQTPRAPGISAEGQNFRRDDSRPFQPQMTNEAYFRESQPDAGMTFFSPIYTAYDGFLFNLPAPDPIDNDAMDVSPYISSMFPSAFEMEHGIEPLEGEQSGPYTDEWNMPSDGQPRPSEPRGPPI
ncbi:MAG: hypothetical protein M1819_006342 [Sarea resinae]|nr:MAG: hypothetical protein M1819_006342 [Sarea resinae]